MRPFGLPLLTPPVTQRYVLAPSLRLGRYRVCWIMFGKIYNEEKLLDQNLGESFVSFTQYVFLRFTSRSKF